MLRRASCRPNVSIQNATIARIPNCTQIWPFACFGLGRPDLAVGVETFQRRIEKASNGWQYDGQSAARLGLTDQAKPILLGKIGNSHGNFRFPAMWGPNYDWLPDQDHGSNIMLTLQHMLLESSGGKIFVLPAWPKQWDVAFKLWAPRRTVVECVYRHGKIEQLAITPQARQQDVRNSPWASRKHPMTPVPSDPTLGVSFHAVGAMFSANCYAPQKYIRRWSWETFWMTQAAWCWLLWPIVGAIGTIPQLFRQVLGEAPQAADV